MLGIIGETERLEGTVIADSVNLACRLDGLCKDFGGGSSPPRNAWREPRTPPPATRFLGELPVRGKAAPVRAYELLV